MQIQVSTNNHIAGSAELAQYVEGEVQAALQRFSRQITRVEVHLSDENSHKSGDADKRCVMEARLAGLQPVAVNHNAPTVNQAVDGAVEKIARVLERTLGKLGHVKGRTSASGDGGI